MSLSIGIVGLPNVGKSTLFNALTGGDALSANYPFATIEPNTGIVPVPDDRLTHLAELYHSQKIVPATIKFVDIAGLVAGASNGEGLGNKFLANIRECDAIIHVVRAFRDENIIHVTNSIKPDQDIETINTELILADLQSLEQFSNRLAREAKSDPKASQKQTIITDIINRLKSGQLINQMADIDTGLIDHLQLLTAKPTIYVFNVDENDFADQAKLQTLTNLAGNCKSVFISAKLEDELKGLAPSDAAELLDSYNINESGLVKLIKEAYEILGLQSYLTAGPQEVRAWTIHQGATAPEAAGVIHTDFERGFIAAQIVNYHDLIEAGSEAAAKAQGKVRTEGRDYVMRPDDVVEFRFNI